METTAHIVADSLSPEGWRITTFELVYPRFILAELNTHRMLAKSTASSRAIPTSKLIDIVENDPFIPAEFTQNKPGMQADHVLSDDKAEVSRMAWIVAAKNAARTARALLDMEVHKQQANRVLEPFLYARTVVTATEWDNFYTLRNSKMAQPEFADLANKMQMAHASSSPRHLDWAEWHMPYSADMDPGLDLRTRLRVSAARCARVSYKTHDGAVSPLDKDIELGERLLAEGHLSPFDHQARPFDAVMRDGFRDHPNSQRQFVGWVPYRVFVEQTAALTCRRFHHA